MFMTKLLDFIFNTFISEKQKIPIIKNYSEINNILKSKNTRKYEYLFHNKKTIHKILYDNEKTIKILPNGNNFFSNLFYLILLIKDQPGITNYIYSFDYIINVNNYRKNSNNILTCFILTMIIIELIDNFRNSEDFYEEIYEDELKAIYEENKKIRDNFINSNEKYYDLNLNKNQVKINNIEEIYSKIVISLITKEKLKDYKLSEDIFNQLGFDFINITENIFQNLFVVFNNNKNFIQKYTISKKDDLYDEQKIAFYYILFKYIFKNSIYIYKIPFLLKSRNTIIKLIKCELDENSKLNNKNIRLKKEFIIKMFCDSNYYFIKYLGQKYEKLKEVLKFYQDFLSESKKEEIKNLQIFIKDLKTKIDYESYLKDFEKAKKLNERSPIIKFLLQEENVNDLNEVIMNEYIKKWDELEQMINDKKLKKMRKNHKILLKRFFNEKNNRDILLKIFKEEIYEYFINETNTEIVDESKNHEMSQNMSGFVIEEKVYNSTDSASEIKAKNESDKGKEKENKSIIKAISDESYYIESKNKKLSNKDNYTIVYDSQTQNDVNFYDESEYEFLSYDKVIGTHEKCAYFVTELKNGFFISGGDKHLLLYNQNYFQVMDEENKAIVSSITEIKTEVKAYKNEIKLITLSKDQMRLITLNTENNDFKIKKYCLPPMSTSACLEIKKK